MRLDKFDIEFFNSLPDKDKIFFIKEGIYHVIIKNKWKIGIIGYIPMKDSKKKIGFIQIVLLPEFRGKGLVKKAEDLIAKKYHLEKLYATIKCDNISSIKSHKKAGFERLSDKQLETLRKKGFLKEDELRFTKKIK